jgi:hypothetical protein
MKTLQLFVLLLCVAIVAPATGFTAERRKGGGDDRGGGGRGGGARVHAVLVIASNEKVPTDGKLRQYEAQLKSSLRYASYRYVGEGSATVSADGGANLSLPQGQSLSLTGDKGGNAVAVQYGGSRISISKGGTVVLAGRSAGPNGEVYAAVVTVN